jgi:phage/plasmid-like protein (TIGR03299 family)
MPAEVESLVLYRQPAWHGLGELKQEVLHIKDAVAGGRIGWTVSKRPIYFEGAPGEALPYPNQIAIVRDTDLVPLGLATDTYQVDQNQDIFDWAEDLIGEGFTVESAGSLRGGQCVFLLVHTRPIQIAGDEWRNYLLLSAWHDGRTASSAKATAQRVVCMNTWNAAMQGAGTSFSYRHTGDLQQKRDLATKAYKMSGTFMDALAMEADVLSSKVVTRQQLIDIVNMVWPEDKNATPREEAARIRKLKAFGDCVKADDIKQFRGTAWAVMQAAADWDTHVAPARETKTWQENRFLDLFDGKGIQNAFRKAIDKVCAVAV